MNSHETQLMRRLVTKINTGSEEEVCTFLSRHSNYMKPETIREAFDRSERPELKGRYIAEIDVQLNDRVMSRHSGRKGNIVGIKSDGESVDVKWDDGIIQGLQKYSLFKITKDTIDSLSQVRTYSTTGVEDNYKSMMDDSKYNFNKASDMDKFISEKDYINQA